MEPYELFSESVAWAMAVGLGGLVLAGKLRLEREVHAADAKCAEATAREEQERRGRLAAEAELKAIRGDTHDLTATLARAVNALIDRVGAAKTGGG